MTTPDSTTPDLEATMPGFLSPPAPTPDPIDPNRTTVTTSSTSSSTSEPTSPSAPSDGDRDESDALSSTTSPLGPSQVSTADPDAFAGMLGIAFGMAGLALHARLTPGDNTCWIPDERDVDDVCGPLSRIIARRVKVSSRAAGDVTDAMDAGVAAVGFVVANLQRQAELRAVAAAGEGWDQQREQDQSA